MFNCAEVRELLQLYLDNELDGRATLATQKHLDSCRECSRLLELFMRQDQRLRQAAQAEPLETATVRRRMLKVLHHSSAPLRRRWAFLPLPLRFMGAMASVVVAVFLLWRIGGLSWLGENTYAAVTSDHAAHCAEANGMDAITDPDQLRQIARVYGNLNALPDLSSLGYAHPRGRLCTVKDLKFFHVVFYRPGEQPLSLFLRPHAAKVISEGLVTRVQDKYTVLSFSRAGIDALIVSPLDPQQTTAIANAVAAQLENYSVTGTKKNG